MEANIHRIRLSGYGTNVKCLSFGTAGSYGIEKLQIEASDVWQGAIISATFLRGDSRIRVCFDDTDTIAVPPEATAEATSERDMGQIVFEGLHSDGKVYTAGMQFTVSGHPDAEGDESQAVTPTEAEQIWLAIQRLDNGLPALNPDILPFFLGEAPADIGPCLFFEEEV